MVATASGNFLCAGTSHSLFHPYNSTGTTSLVGRPADWPGLTGLGCTSQHVHPSLSHRSPFPALSLSCPRLKTIFCLLGPEGNRSCLGFPEETGVAQCPVNISGDPRNPGDPVQVTDVGQEREVGCEKRARPMPPVQPRGHQTLALGQASMAGFSEEAGRAS